MSSPALSIGAYGEDVRQLQASLLRAGYHIPAPEAARGFFGSATRQAVRRYQAKNRLPVTGVVEARTAAQIAPAAGPRDGQRSISALALPGESAGTLTGAESEHEAVAATTAPSGSKVRFEYEGRSEAGGPDSGAVPLIWFAGGTGPAAASPGVPVTLQLGADPDVEAVTVSASRGSESVAAAAVAVPGATGAWSATLTLPSAGLWMLRAVVDNRPGGDRLG